MKEVLDHHHTGIENSTILDMLSLTAKEYYVVSAHREENVDTEANIVKLITTLNKIADKFNRPIIFSTHPRTKKKLDALNLQFNPLIQVLKPLGFKDYIKLQIEAKAVLSDSGTITEESSILNFAAINLRETHERHEGMEEGAVMMTGLNTERIFQALAILEDQPIGLNRLLHCVTDYAADNVSDKILRIIMSYTDYVNRVVWRRY